jgi:putative FmdB family regulatory protein
MPIFEYQCDKCGEHKSLIKKYDERKEQTEHSNCGGVLTFVDKIHASSFQLKGTGWYETDFKHK